MRRSRTALASEHGVVKTNRRQPPPTHLADVLGGFLIDSREGSDLKQPECSTKKLMLSKAKLGEDIPGGSPSESVPTPDELDHGALITDPTRFHGLVAVTGTPPSRAGIALMLHRRLPFSERNRRYPARGCPVKQSGRRPGSPRRRRCSRGRRPVAIRANPRIEYRGEVLDAFTDDDSEACTSR